MISNRGFDQGNITFYVNPDMKAGDPVTMYATNTCVTAKDGDKFIGVLYHSRETLGSVQVRGYVRLPYTGNDPQLGFDNLVANGEGGVRVADDGRTVAVIGVDTDKHFVEMIL